MIASPDIERARKAIRAGRSPNIHLTARIPTRYQGKALEDMKGLDKTVKKAKATILTGQSLLITGPCGTGKTHMAIGLLNEWCAEKLKISPEIDGEKKIYQTRTALFLSTVELFYELKDTFGSGISETENKVLTKYAKVDLLVLDDLGAEKRSEWARQVFYLLLDRRYRDIRQTIITTNLALEEIAEIFDDRVASRLCEMGQIITLEGEDRRLREGDTLV